MKPFLIITLVLFILKSAIGQDIKSPFTIDSNKKVGNWLVGEPIDSLKAHLPDNWTIQIDSMDYCEGCFDFYEVYNLQLDNEVLLKIEPDWESRILFRFWIKSDRFTTDKGFKLGMTVRQLRQYYNIEDVIVAGDIGIAVIVKGFKGSFKIDSRQYDGNIYELNKNNLPDELTIEEIIIVK